MAITAIPGVILAGGQGRRIGGDKPHAILAGQPLWHHVAERVAPQVSVLAMNGLAEDGFESAPDPLPGLGPLSGILAAMLWAKGRGALRVVTAPVDTPFLPDDLVERLAQPAAPIALAQTGCGIHGTCGIWDTALAPALEEALQGGTRKVTDWALGQGAVAVTFPDTTPLPFFNINTAEDLARAEGWV